jgi:uncharacterized membrane protein
MQRIVLLATLVAALGSGLVAGTFFAFSTFVMPALARLPPADGVAAMQSINIAVVNRWFLGVFLGTALVCGALAVSAAFSWSDPNARWRLAGALAYCVGVILVTRTCHIPRNEALALLSAQGAEAASYWPRYLADWTTWNHARGAAALVAAALLTLSLTACGPLQSSRTCDEPSAGGSMGGRSAARDARSTSDDVARRSRVERLTEVDARERDLLRRREHVVAPRDAYGSRSRQGWSSSGRRERTTGQRMGGGSGATTSEAYRSSRRLTVQVSPSTTAPPSSSPARYSLCIAQATAAPSKS